MLLQSTTDVCGCIELLRSDGEQFNLGSEGVFAGFEMDPVMIEDYNASGVTSRYGPDCHDVAGHHENATLCRDWFSHTSAWRAGFAARWRDTWLQPSPRTKYGEYLIAGTQSGTGNWTYMRQIMTPESVDGQRTGRLGAMRYSKASIYPGASGPGGYDTGWMGGLDDLEMYVCPLLYLRPTGTIHLCFESVAEYCCVGISRRRLKPVTSSSHHSWRRDGSPRLRQICALHSGSAS